MILFSSSSSGFMVPSFIGTYSLYTGTLIYFANVFFVQKKDLQMFSCLNFSGTRLAHNSVNCCGSCSKLTKNIVRILRPRLLFQTPMNMYERQLSYSQQLPSFDQNIMFYHGISISVECFVVVLHFITRQRCLLCRCFLFCL